MKTITLRGPLFRLAARASAAVAFRKGETLQLTYRQPDSVANLAISTRYVDRGFDIPVPGDLWLDAFGEADAIQDALTKFGNAGNVIGSVISFGTNAAIASFEPEVVYESTPGVARRPFFQRFLPDERPDPIAPRFANSEAIGALIAAIERHQEKDRITRAIAQYSLALENWRLGSEVLALAHLFMSAEALKTAMWRDLATRNAKLPVYLATEWGYVANRRMSVRQFLDAEARRRLVFRDDVECHREAKETSDQFEHGFANAGVLFAPARAWVVPTAGHVRAAVLSLLDLAADVRATLEGEEYATPSGPRRIETYLWGELLGEGEELAAPGNVYPILAWKRTPSVKSVQDSSGKRGFAFSVENTLTASLAEGVRFMPRRMEMWDGSKAGAGNDHRSEWSFQGRPQ